MDNKVTLKCGNCPFLTKGHCFRDTKAGVCTNKERVLFNKDETVLKFNAKIDKIIEDSEHAVMLNCETNRITHYIMVMENAVFNNDFTNNLIHNAAELWTTQTAVALNKYYDNHGEDADRSMMGFKETYGLCDYPGQDFDNKIETRGWIR